MLSTIRTSTVFVFVYLPNSRGKIKPNKNPRPMPAGRGLACYFTILFFQQVRYQHDGDVRMFFKRVA